MAGLRQRWIVAGVVSAGFHVALGLWVSRRAPADVAPVEAPTQISVRFVEPPPPVEPAAPEVSEVELAPAPAPAPVARRRPAARRRAPAAPAVEPGPAVVSELGSGPSAESSPGAAGPAAPGAPADGLDLSLHPRGPGSTLLPRPPPRAPAGPKLRPRADGGYDIRDSQFSARIAPDGTLTFEDKTALQKWHGTSYEIDVTDMVMRAIGDDPYGHAKEQVRLQTQALRADMAERACELRLERSLLALHQRLKHVWADPNRTKEARRALLFQLWDDCAEEGDAERLAVAEKARRLVYEFIREHLPKGSADGYDAGEIAALNERRRSKARFRPY